MLPEKELGQLCCLKKTGTIMLSEKEWGQYYYEQQTKTDHDQTSKDTICFLN